MSSAPSHSLNVKLNRLYIKEIICKVPQAPGFFIAQDEKSPTEPPQFSIEMHVKHQPISSTQHEVVLHATVLAKTADKITAFSIDVQQAGLFTIEHSSTPTLTSLLKNHCPSLLYPYLARAISDASIQLGFPPVLLSPLNIELPAAPAEEPHINEIARFANGADHEKTLETA